jgi:hypothetical protein
MEDSVLNGSKYSVSLICSFICWEGALLFGLITAVSYYLTFTAALGFFGEYCDFVWHSGEM